MMEIRNATTEIRSLMFAVTSVAMNTEGRSPEEIDLAVALLDQQISARCDFIDEACKAPARESTAVTRKKAA
jgi:ferritin-like protein